MNDLHRFFSGSSRSGSTLKLCPVVTFLSLSMKEFPEFEVVALAASFSNSVGTVRSMILRGERVVLRSGTEADVERLVAILREPTVARWWSDPGTDEAQEVREDFVGADSGFVIEVDGEAIGAIQYSEEKTPMYRHAGIDLFLTTSRHGQGIGTDAVRTLARYLIEDRGHHRLTIDPAADNVAAIRCYEKVGFRPVGLMRKYERGPDGTWHDGLLMDLLAEELVTS